MPKIEAATVAEHRTMIQCRLVDAAEQLMRAHRPLTAAAVAGSAGIARNSIYRYVDSVDELRDLVVDRYLPQWLAAVDAELAAAEPTERVVVWVRANLRQAADSGHGWLMASTRPAPVAVVSDGAVDRAHLGMRDALYQSWLDLTDGDRERAAVATGLTAALLESGFRRLESSDPDLVIELTTRAAAGLVAALSQPQLESV